MKIKQLAIQVPDIERAKLILSHLFEANFNMDDDLKMDGSFLGKNCKNIPVSLSFDFDVLQSCNELELIKSKSYDHWHSEHIDGFTSHLGVYCESKEELYHICEILNSYGFEIIQNSISSGHSRPNQDGSERRYIDIIYNSSSVIGFNIKLSLKV